MFQQIIGANPKTTLVINFLKIFVLHPDFRSRLVELGMGIFDSFFIESDSRIQSLESDSNPIPVLSNLVDSFLSIPIPILFSPKSCNISRIMRYTYCAY